MKKLLVFFAVASAYAATTTVSQSIVAPDGSPASGTVHIRITAPCASGSDYVGSKTVSRSFAGTLTVKLVPNDTCSVAGTSYTVGWTFSDGRTLNQSWVVPTSVSPVTVESVVVASAPVVSPVIGLTGGGTAQTTWTAARCVQVSADGTKLESAAAACGTGSAAFGELTGSPSDNAALLTALGLKAPLASPTFTGNVTIGVTVINADGTALSDDVPTPVDPPASGKTLRYTKGGKVCSLSAAGVETCPGAGVVATITCATGLTQAGTAADPTCSIDGSQVPFKFVLGSSGSAGMSVSGAKKSDLLQDSDGAVWICTADTGDAWAKILVNQITNADIANATIDVTAKITGVVPPANLPAGAIGATFSGGGAALSSGTTPGVSLSYLPPLPSGCTAIAWTVTVDTGTAGFRVWRKAAGTAVPTVADTITTGDLAIATGTSLRSTSMTNFSGSIAPVFAAGDIIGVHINAVSGNPTFASFTIQCQ